MYNSVYVYVHKDRVVQLCSVHMHICRIAPVLLYSTVSEQVHESNVRTSEHVHLCKIAPGLLYFFMYIFVFVHKRSVHTAKPVHSCKIAPGLL